MKERNYYIKKNIRAVEERLESILSRNGRRDLSEPEAILLDMDDLKLLFRITSRTLYYWIREENIPYQKIKGRNYFSLAAILNLLLQHRFPREKFSEDISPQYRLS